MKKIQNSVLVIAAAIAFMMTGCQSNAGSSAESEALKEQIARLEQQISDLEQRQSATGNDGASREEVPTTADSGVQEQDSAVSDSSAQSAADANIGSNTQQQMDASAADSQQKKNDTIAGKDNQSQGSAENPGNDTVGLTTYTMEDLSSMVNAFETKAGAVVPGGNAAQDMEQFFALKQEEKQIDDALDSHEDELEYHYKNGALTREEYKKLERELELLEDKLDNIEDQLEHVFGIDE